jgi:hypothetical protein
VCPRQIKNMKRPLVFAWCALLALGLAQKLPAQKAGVPTSPSAGSAKAIIPFDQIGAVAGKQYSGKGLAVESSPDGARLYCSFQKLNAQVTTEGLSLASAVDGVNGEGFRVIARTLGRASAETMPLIGKVEVAGQVVKFIRSELTEEYSVSVDGLRQDFVIARRPEGTGLVRLELEVDGAKAEAKADGAQLALAKGGRKLAYNRLKAEDARGKEVKVRMEVVSASRVAMLVDDADAVYPVRIDPTFSDVNWVSMTGLLGANSLVYSAVADASGNLYIGGMFYAIGDTLATGVAKWNGTNWSPLGSGMSPVYALAVSGNTLYAGGWFTSAGGTNASYIAQWDGTNWSPLGLGMGPMNGYVYALAVSGSDLYAGGYFATAGGIGATNIAKWDGSTWSALGSGMGGNSRSVLALAVSGTNLYAGGNFTSAGGVAATNIAEWNGSAWSALGSGTSGAVEALAVSGSTLYAGGNFTTAGDDTNANHVAQWDGANWSSMGSGMNGAVYALAVSGPNLYAGGAFTTAGGTNAHSIAEWNGSGWSALGSGVNNPVNALVASGNTLFAGGGFYFTGDLSVALNCVAQWNGTGWSALGSGMNGGVNSLAVVGSMLYAGGEFITAGNVTNAHYIAQWNGTNWSALGSGLTGDVQALAVSGTNLYIGGGFAKAGGSNAFFVAQWNGNQWSPLGTGLSGAVKAMAVSGSTLYAGGGFTSARNIPAVKFNGIAQWDGSTWSALGSGMGGNSSIVLALAVSGATLYAGGEFTTAGGTNASHVAQWNGSTWSPLGSGMGAVGGNTPIVSALAVSGATLYAGGEFTTAGGNEASYIAKWDGTNWSSLGSGVSSGRFNDTEVTALMVSGADLYVGGVFITAGDIDATNIAVWDGSSWSALGSGMNNAVIALATLGNTLYAGGDFLTIGGKSSPFIASASLMTGTMTFPTASAILSGNNFILTWPTTATGFLLQSTTNLNSPVVWTTNSPAPVIVNGQNTVTDAISGPQKFYRLIR